MQITCKGPCTKLFSYKCKCKSARADDSLHFQVVTVIERGREAF